ncbi:MAG: twin-arginine translocase TatA/TatE family subunit [Holosporales bacterium]|jgi:sec-independent protein translocase protein TatB
MFELAWSEIAVVGLVALLLFGPEEMARGLWHLGRWVGRVNKAIAEFRSQVDALGFAAEARAMREEVEKAAGHITASRPSMPITETAVAIIPPASSPQVPPPPPAPPPHPNNSR